MGLTRKEKKEQTRAALVRATLDALLDLGPARLTTGKIAQRAGVAQPTFYVHFSGIEEALDAVADEVEAGLRRRLGDSRKNLVVGGPYDMIRHAFEVSVRTLLREPRLTALFLRYRRDPSTPLGRRFKAMLERNRDSLLRDLRALGMTDDMVGNLEVHAHLMTGMTLTIVEGLLDGTLTDEEACFDTLTRVTMGANRVNH